MIKGKVYFKNREDASHQLLDVLPVNNMKLDEWIVVSASKGGYPIAKIIAKVLNAKLEFFFTAKIFASNNNTCEVAIISENKEVVIHEELVKAFKISLDCVFLSAKDIYENELLKTIKEYRSKNTLKNLKNKNILLVDEGLNTGLTMMACIKTAINLGAKSVSVAVPILPSATVKDVESISDDLYYVKNLDHFITLDIYYDELDEVTLEEINNN